jgi:hypothetical protein
LDELGTRSRGPELSENLKVTLYIIDAPEELMEFVVVEDVVNKKELEACILCSQFLHLTCYLERLFAPVTPPLEIQVAEFASSLHRALLDPMPPAPPRGFQRQAGHQIGQTGLSAQFIKVVTVFRHREIIEIR